MRKTSDQDLLNYGEQELMEELETLEKRTLSENTLNLELCLDKSIIIFYCYLLPALRLIRMILG